MMHRVCNNFLKLLIFISLLVTIMAVTAMQSLSWKLVRLLWSVCVFGNFNFLHVGHRNKVGRDELCNVQWVFTMARVNNSKRCYLLTFFFSFIGCCFWQWLILFVPRMLCNSEGRQGCSLHHRFHMAN